MIGLFTCFTAGPGTADRWPPARGGQRSVPLGVAEGLRNRVSRVLGQVRGHLGVPGSDDESHLRLESIELGLDPAQPWTYVPGYFLTDEADAQQGSHEESEKCSQGEDHGGH